MKTQFATNLKSKRLSFGWSQAKAAEEISKQLVDPVSETRYQQWELGRSEPEYDILIIITEVFGIDDQYLFMKKQLNM